MSHIFLSFIFYNIFLFLIIAHYRRGNYYIKKSQLFIYTLFLIAFGTYGGGEGDYLHYKEAVENIQSLGDIFYYASMEIQYYYLAYLLDGNYTMWRLVVFSIQFVGLGWFIYKAKLNTYPVLLTYTSLFLVTSVYGRVYWGVIYFFMGLYLLVEKKNPLYLIAIALCYVSHTSCLILIALLPLAFINLKRWHFFVIIILFGSITTLFSDYFNLIIGSGGMEGADYINMKVNNYSNTTNYTRNYMGESIGEKVIFLMRYVPLFFIFVFLLSVFIRPNKKNREIYKPLQSSINVYLGICFIAFVFLFADMNNGAYFYKALAMTHFPITLILPYLAKNKYIKKQTFNLYILFFLLTTEANYMKDLYYAYASGV